jgi:hypothetical protein
MNTLKGIAAVVAGLVFIIVTQTGTDYVLRAAGIFPPSTLDANWMLALAIIYRCIFDIAGGYLTAFIAPASKMRYASALGAVVTALAVMVFIAAMAYGVGLFWNPLIVAILSFPCVWLGGKLQTRGA